MLSSKTLDLACLEAFDPHGGRELGINRRYCCPFCGIAKSRDTAHRCLIYHAESGAWNCKRCGESGKLRDFWDDPNGLSTSSWNNARGYARKQRAQFSQLSDEAVHTTTETAKNWRFALSDLQLLEGTPGASYLTQRGIPLDVARLASVRFAHNFYGRPAVVFPIRDRAGDLVAAQGRHTDGKDDPKARTCGPKSRGVFVAPATICGQVCGPFDERSPGIIICEAPLDALSIAACGFPALALVGINGEHTKGPNWLRVSCGLRSVFAAFDADSAGEAATLAVSAYFATYGAKCKALRPDGAKDWNEALCKHGLTALKHWLSERILPSSRVGQHQPETVAALEWRSQLEAALGYEASIQAVEVARLQIESTMNESQLRQWRQLPESIVYEEVLCVALLNAEISP